MGFDDAVKNLMLQAEACPLVILVWGPGRESVEHFEKRQKIKREVGDRFRNAHVLFSEDVDLERLLRGYRKMSYPDQESWHLAACDVCVVLDTSRGAGEEIAHFVRSAHASKLLILTHERHQHSTGFPAAIRRYENQLFYNDQEYESCNLVEQVLTRIYTTALQKLFRM